MKKRIIRQTSEWVKLSAEVKDRDGYKCRKCRHTKQLTVHHIVPRDRGGRDVSANLITLCSPCHDWAEMRLEESHGEPVPWEELIKPPSGGKERRIWYQDATGHICAYVLD